MKTTSTPFARLALAFNLFMALALLFTMAATPASAASQCTETHVVSAHDTIWRLVKEYGVPATRIAQANKLEQPYTLKVGQEVCIPPKSAGGLSATISISSTLTTDSITLTGSGFPKAHVYRVKARNAGTWYVLGDNLRADKNGDLQKVRYKLPAELRGQPELTICLKDMGTDALGCFTATLQ